MLTVPAFRELVKPPSTGRAQHIRVYRGGYWHHGIDLGNGQVIHYTGEVARKRNASVKVTSLAEFLSGGKRHVVHHRDSFPDDVVIRRALSRLGEHDYDLWGNNCEHFAIWAKTGRHQSEQIERLKQAGRVFLPQHPPWFTP